MNKTSVIILSVVGLFVLMFFIFVTMIVSIANKEVSIRTAIEQKQRDNKSEFDNLFKKISQTAQVSEKAMSVLKDILIGHAQARNTKGDNSVFNWIQESVPNVDMTVFNNLQNIITSSRDSFTMRQKELLDFKREHDILLKSFPSGMILSFLGRKPIDVQIITSTRSEKAFEMGKDDDIEVFKK